MPTFTVSGTVHTWVGTADDLADALRRMKLEGKRAAGCTLTTLVGTGKDFSYHDFSSCNLSGVNFTNANLQGCDFTNANLSAANLTGANLNYANLTGANLKGANLSGVTGRPTGGGV